VEASPQARRADITWERVYCAHDLELRQYRLNLNEMLPSEVIAFRNERVSRVSEN
jgi:hypothetical protein